MRVIEKKGKALLFIMSAVVMLVIFFTNDFGISGSMDNLKIEENEYSKIMETRTEKEGGYNFEVKVNDYLLPFDESTNAFLLSIDENEDIEEYNPNFEIIIEENINYDVALLNTDLTAESIQNNEPLHLLFYTEEEYREFKIHLTDLPILTLDLDYALEEENSPIGDTNQKASMTLYDNSSGLDRNERVTDSDLYIRLRGGSSRGFDKNQYRINLREFTIGGDESNNHLSLLDMREDDDWIIYSPYNDPEKVRNTFSNNLWHETMAAENRFGINTGTEGEYVEIFIDGRYWGLYTLMHPIDDKQVDLDLENNVEESEIYYRSISNVRFDPKTFEESTGNERVLGRFELRDVNEPWGEKEQWYPLYEHLMVRNEEKEVLENYLYERTDIENQINYYLFTLLLQATDNNYKNHNYFSKIDGDTRVMLESPWDLDLTWGLHWQPDHHVLAVVRGDPTLNRIPSATLIHYAIENGSEDIIQQVKEKYEELRNGSWSEEAMMSALDEYEADIYMSGSILRDKNRWPQTAFNENMDHLRDYVLVRLESMDEFIENEI